MEDFTIIHTIPAKDSDKYTVRDAEGEKVTTVHLSESQKVALKHASTVFSNSQSEQQQMNAFYLEQICKQF